MHATIVGYLARLHVFAVKFVFVKQLVHNTPLAYVAPKKKDRRRAVAGVQTKASTIVYDFLRFLKIGVFDICDQTLGVA